ncbi:hypothetical protein [Desulfomonile tiedjei]|uniref:Uncharacterized protein n=1 Tax=Desulfomonile tiedjei (strain ATCC 49306 / DSM 6799 / DCB-1) TaxID=706587 RepID=I4CF93_DESTA|nr:hypothetical protein [Desulfomonile tiedjei]AFM28234.1 hypothetical protein Desti_5655 [Desulfomonile tiedjei DSM 6799]
MPKQISFPDEARHAVRSALMDTYERQEELEQAIKSLKRFRKIATELEKYVSKGWPFHVLSLMEKQDEFIRQQCDAGAFSLQDLEKLRAAAQEQAKKLRIRYPNYLELACREAGLPLDMSSRYPVYTFEKGFFELTIDRGGTATLSNSERKLGEFPADIGAVVAKLAEEHERIFARPYDGRYFLKKLREHYLGVIQREKLADGADVPIRRIAARMASDKKGYQSDQFIVDLSRLAREGPLEIDSRRLELLHTRDDEAGMLLHEVGSVAYVGFVRFEEVGA